MTRPEDIAGRYGSIPVEMKGLKQWVIWGKNEEEPKCPYSPLSPVAAKANDSATWGTFDEAVAARSALGRGGIGFEFGVTPGGIAGIDLDHVLNEAGELAGWASEIVEAMDSYTEYSPSGRGLHILCRITEPMSGFCVAHKKPVDGGGVIEVYDSGRYFTVTGQVYGERKALNERTEALKKICSKYLAAPAPESRKEKPLRSAQERNSAGADVLTNAELWERMFDASNGREIWALYRGNTEAYGGDESRADMALCTHLAFWTGNDARRMDEMFKESGLMRPKWDERRGTQTYGERTIEKARNVTTESYTVQSQLSQLAVCGRRGPSLAAALRPQANCNTVCQEFINDTSSSNPPVEATGEAQVKPVSEYLDEFLAGLLKSREGQAISTGFEELDSILDGGLYPGLYVLGAISSLGKTTLTLQIADNIAKSGKGVMIFSLEMSRTELMAKTLSRESLVQSLAHTQTTKHAQTTRGILRASFSADAGSQEILQAVVGEYHEWGRKETIHEGIGDIGTGAIRSTVEAYMSEHDGIPPVIVIDYLQILAAVDLRATDKQNTDRNVTELKRISRDYQTPVIGISSFNRENYAAPVNMAAFKESGAIEYSSDVLIGMQVEGLDRMESEGEKEYKARVQSVLEGVSRAKASGEPIGIECKILKHRNGRTGTLRLEYYPRYNYFKAKGGSVR